jgi:hypothetical protein
MEHTISCQDHSTVNLSEYDDGVWISVHRTGAHVGVPLTRKQAIELRDALTAAMETENAAQ